MLFIWHNPRCSKSRQTLALIEAAGVEVHIRYYLKDAPSVGEIKDMIAQLGMDDPRALMRTGEAIYKDEGLRNISDPAVLIGKMAEFPILIERPLVSNRHTAIIGRPPEAVNTLL